MTDTTDTTDITVLKPFQVDAVDVAVERYVAGKSQLIFGGTGSGKTLVSLHILHQSAMRLASNDDTTDQFALVVVPSQGGNVPMQWLHEIRRTGTPATYVLLFAGSRRLTQFDEWKRALSEHVRPLSAHSPLAFVVVTHHVVAAEIRKMQLCTEYVSPLMSTKWQHVVVDEAHVHRNGAPKDKTAVEIDESKTLFPALMRTLKNNDPFPRVLAVTATPFFNSPLDVYSLMVAMNVNGRSKTTWTDENDQRARSIQKQMFLREHTTKIVVPDSISRFDDIVHHTNHRSLSEIEVKLALPCYVALQARLLKLISLLSRSQQQPHNAGLKQEVNEASQAVQAEVTRARRGAQHPAFYDPTLYHPSKKDRNGRSITIPLPLERCDDFSLAECTKFNEVVDVVRSNPGERFLVTSWFSRPLDFLKRHIERELPDTQVCLHHGGTDCTSAMREFAAVHTQEPTSKVMLATAGSVGEGVNVAMTTHDGTRAVRLVCLDMPLTSAAQQQLEGRIKRPLAQENVHKWHVHHVTVDAPISNGGRLNTLPTIDDAQNRILANKKRAATDTLTSEEEAEERCETGNISTANTTHVDGGTLAILLNTTTEWILYDNTSSNGKRGASSSLPAKRLKV
jgi:hypothetical protein